MYTLNKMVIKPTLRCFHNCGYCKPRQKFYNTISNQKAYNNVYGGNISIEKIKSAVTEAHDAGMSECLLSGGDPILYPFLTELISHISSFKDVFVYMNSTGTNISDSKLNEVLISGLKAWNFSIDTVDEIKYDNIRGLKGGFRLMLKALNMLLDIRKQNKRYSGFYINIMTVLSRFNYTELPEIFNFAIKNNISSVYLMNVYGDQKQKEFLLSSDQIKHFKTTIIPICIDVFKSYQLNKIIVDNAYNVLTSFYSCDSNSLENYENGIFWKDDTIKEKCKTPEHYALIEADGRVLPCCVSEIYENEDMGNIYYDSFKNIWNGSKFSQFRKEKMNSCKYCPIHQNKTIGLVLDMCKQFGA